jgi:hypothetical protein
MNKSLVLIFTLALAGIVVGQDDQTSQETMENADMSDGTTHWHGDCKAAGADEMTDFVTHPTTLKGITIDLHSTSWTKVSQEIHRYKSTGPQILTIVYQTSPGLTFSTLDRDYTNLGPIIDFPGANIPPSIGKITALIDMPPNQRAVLSSTANNTNTYLIYNDKVTSASFAPKTDQSPQTFTAQLLPPPATQDDNPTFVIAFPPGSGTITISKISLLPGHVGGGAPQ